MHCYHHAAGDGSTGLLAMKGIFERYSKLVAGEKVDHYIEEGNECKEHPQDNLEAKDDILTQTIHPSILKFLKRYWHFWWQVSETSLQPMESVETITSAVQLDSSKEKVENIYM